MRTRVLEEPEDDMCEPAWSEPLELTGAAVEGQASRNSSTPTSKINPTTLMRPKKVDQIPRFLALKLTRETMSNKDLDKHL